MLKHTCPTSIAETLIALTKKFKFEKITKIVTEITMFKKGLKKINYI